MMKKLTYFLVAVFLLIACNAFAFGIIKQATSTSVMIGPFLDDTDGVTPETGLTISNTDVRISINGGNMAAKNAGGCTHDEIGWYTCTFDATDTANEGMMQIMVNESGALPVYHTLQIVNAVTYESLYSDAGDDYIQSDARQIEGIDATDQLDSHDGNPLPATEDGSSFINIPFRTVEGAYDEDDILRLISSVLFGKMDYTSGTLTSVFRDIGDTKDRVTIIYGAGDRTSVTINDAN